MSVPSNLSPGTVVDLQDRQSESALRFTVVAPLSAGANSETHLAQGWDGVFVVLKCARHEGPSHDLQIESRILEQVEHENLVRYLGSGHSPTGQLVLGSERVFENPLELMRRPEVRKHFPDDPGTYYYPLPLPIAIRMGLDLFRGLEAMHKAGFVHHDVKPQNFMIRVESQRRVQAPKRHVLLQEFLAGRAQGILIDVGASRSAAYLADLSAGREDPALIPPQATPIFAPPELLLAEEVDGQTRRQHHPSLDVYAGALLAYSLFTGRSAYDHLKGDVRRDLRFLFDTKREERRHHVQPMEESAFSRVKGLGAQAVRLHGFLAKCLHPDTGRRPSLRDAVRTFERLERGLAGGLGRTPERHFGKQIRKPPPRGV